MTSRFFILRLYAGAVKKARTVKKAEKYKKSNNLKDKQNDSKQRLLCFFIK